MLVGVVRGVTIHFSPAAANIDYILMFFWCCLAPARLLGEPIEKFENKTVGYQVTPSVVAVAALSLLPLVIEVLGLLSHGAVERGADDRAPVSHAVAIRAGVVRARCLVWHWRPMLRLWRSATGCRIRSFCRSFGRGVRWRCSRHGRLLMLRGARLIRPDDVRSQR